MKSCSPRAGIRFPGLTWASCFFAVEAFAVHAFSNKFKIRYTIGLAKVGKLCIFLPGGRLGVVSGRNSEFFVQCC